MSKTVKTKNKNTKKINILVTGVGGPAGINICKLLMKQKKFFNILAMDINSHSAGQFLSHQYFIGERVSDEKKYLSYLTDFIISNKVNILIPTVAEELVLMERLEKKLQEAKYTSCKIIVSENKVLELCDQKDKLYKWMTKNFTDYMGKWMRLDKKVDWKSENYFIKPVKGRGSRGCKLVSKKELEFLMKNNKTEMQDFIVMEVLPGREWTVDCYINSDGSFAYIVPRLRLGLSGGISSLGRTDRNEQVIKQTREVFEKLNRESKVFGPVFVQWKESGEVDEITGNLKIKMVEINPRASGALTITALAGADAVKCLKSEIIDHMPCTNLRWKEVTVTRYFEEKVVKSKDNK